MPRSVRVRFWAESVLGGLSAVLCAVTVLWRDWIEVAFRVDPDAGSGALEWAIVLALAVAAIAAGALARAEWRRATATA